MRKIRKSDMMMNVDGVATLDWVRRKDIPEQVITMLTANEE